MSRVSVVLPAREEPFLQRTIDDVLTKAHGEVEIIAVLDGWEAPLKAHPQVKVVKWSQPRGLRPAINAGMATATGKFVMKLDAHCAVSPGFDIALQEQCDDNWIVVPTKYSLNVDEWVPCKDAWQYYYLTFPWDLTINHIGLQDKNLDRSWNTRFADKPIDDIVTFQGSCWFLSRTHWEQRLAPMDAEHYYYAQEPQEIGLKTWLGGGRVVVNKQVWYAHLFKGRSHRRGFPRFTKPWIRAHEWSANYWMHKRAEPGKSYSIEWLVKAFWDVLKAENGKIGGWPDDWQNPQYEAAALARAQRGYDVVIEEEPALAVVGDTRHGSLITERVQGNANPPPRYDDVFAAGSEWLESLAGEPVRPLQGTLVEGGTPHARYRGIDITAPQVQCTLANTAARLAAKYRIGEGEWHYPIEIKGVVRDDLPALFKELGFTQGAEIGVWQAEYTRRFCEAGLQMLAVDAWAPYAGYGDYTRRDRLEESYAIAVKTLAPFSGTRVLRALSAEAVKQVPDRSLDFVYIDANHDLPHVLEDITLWSAKVKSGGIISGHDYKNWNPALKNDVVTAVHQFTDAQGIKPWFVLGRRKRRRGEPCDAVRSWMWVNP
jgi:glycosyltransferase involved in cell wall biosynthesis